MNREQIERATAEAKARAEALAQEHFKRAIRPGASEGDLLCAQTALLILENAATRANSIPIEMRDKLIAEMKELEETTFDAAKDLARTQGIDAALVSLERLQHIPAALASLERIQDRGLAAIAQHALNAWNDAVAKLLEVGAPLDTPPTSPAAH